MNREIFISYSSKDIVIAKKMCDFLESEGLTCWIAPRNIVPGREYGEEIINGLEESKVFVLLYSSNANDSQHVLREVERAVSKRLPIIAYKIEEIQLTKSMEYFLLMTQWLDATGSRYGKFEELKDSIRILLNQIDEVNHVDQLTLINNTVKQDRKKILPIVLGSLATLVLMVGIGYGFGKINKNKESDNKNYVSVVEESISPTSTEIPEESSIPVTTIVPLGSENPSLEPIENAESKKASPEDNASIEAASESESTDRVDDVEKKDKKEKGKNPTEQSLSIKVGEYIQLGNYKAPGFTSSNNDDSIIWVVIHVDKTKGQVMLLADQILDMKPYDVAESGKHDEYNGEYYDREKLDSYTSKELVQFKGSNDWSQSNIRSWLNSDARKVSYTGQKPVSRGSDDCCNGYDAQVGFLYDFETWEKNLLCNYKGDKVFLLSLDEINKYVIGNGIDQFTSPTKSAINSDKSTWYQAYKDAGRSNYLWALRTPEKDSEYQIKVIGSGANENDQVVVKSVSAAGLGIRPAVVVNLKNVKLTGDGSYKKPYVMK